MRILNIQMAKTKVGGYRRATFKMCTKMSEMKLLREFYWYILVAHTHRWRDFYSLFRVSRFVSIFGASFW